MSRVPPSAARRNAVVCVVRDSDVAGSFTHVVTLKKFLKIRSANGCELISRRFTEAS